MKRALFLLLVLVMLLSLCACGRDDTQSTDSSATPGQATTDGTEEPTDGTADGTQDPTKETTTTIKGKTTTTPTKILADKTTETPPAKATETPSNKTTKTPDDENTEAPDDEPAESSDDNSSETPDTKPSACEHTYTVASCTTPKICTKCQHIAGHSLPHNYKNGTCTVCGKPEILATFEEGDWVANIVKAGTGEQGEVLSQYILTQDKGQYENVVCYSNASACVLNMGKVIYNNKTYYADWYPLLFTSVTWEESGNTITVVSRHSESPYEIILTKTSETQLKVISSTDKTNLPVGTVFNKA